MKTNISPQTKEILVAKQNTFVAELKCFRGRICFALKCLQPNKNVLTQTKNVLAARTKSFAPTSSAPKYVGCNNKYLFLTTNICSRQNICVLDKTYLFATHVLNNYCARPQKCFYRVISNLMRATKNRIN